jgi:uncharacterized protein Yka (UPF0111/DUF47 family)
VLSGVEKLLIKDPLERVLLIFREDLVVIFAIAIEPFKDAFERSKDHRKECEESEESADCFKHGLNLTLAAG